MDKYTAEKMLGLEGEYTARDVNKAYRRLAMKFHPDKAESNGMSTDAANERMSKINEAKNTLCDIFDRTCKISMSCDTTPFDETAYQNARYSDAVKDARRRAEERAQEKRRESYTTTTHSTGRAAASTAASAAAKAGKGTVKVGKKVFSIANILRKLFSYDMIHRFIFLFIAAALVSGAKTQLTYGIFSGMTVAGVANMLVPFVTTPMRKLALKIIDRISPI